MATITEMLYQSQLYCEAYYSRYQHVSTFVKVEFLIILPANNIVFFLIEYECQIQIILRWQFSNPKCCIIHVITTLFDRNEKSDPVLSDLGTLAINLKCKSN